MNSDNWSGWTTRGAALAVVLALFIAGAVTGAALYRWAELDSRKDPRGPRPRAPWEMLAPLRLSADQQQQVRALYERRKPELDQVLAEAMPKLRKVQESIDADVLKLLTDEQRTQYNAMRAHRPPPPGMPPPMGPHGPPDLFPPWEHRGPPPAPPAALPSSPAHSPDALPPDATDNGVP